MPARKIGVYTRFLEYANFRSPLSTFLFNVLRHYRINLSQLSVITAAKVSHFEILCRVHSIEPTVGLFCCFYVNSKNKGWMYFSKRPDSDAVCYTKPLNSLKHWNDHFFWVDSFACLASFLWHTDKNVSRDPFPKSTEFNAEDYVVLVANLTPFWKFSEPFLCLVGMSHNYTMDEDTYLSFLHEDETVADPTKVRVVERERAEGEAKLLDSTVGRIVPLLAGDFAVGGGQDAETELVMRVKIIADENVVAERPKRPRKKRPVVTDASGSSHPPKKLRGDYETSSRAATGGKSSSVLKELLASSILNVEVGVIAVATLPLVTSSISTTPEREGDNPTDSITGLNLHTVGPSERSAVVPPVMTEAVVTSSTINAPSIPEIGTNVTTPVHAFMFHDSDST
ncbi:hypothetical protein Tco_1436622 [Tanacetum coccineum]